LDARSRERERASEELDELRPLALCNFLCDFLCDFFRFRSFFSSLLLLLPRSLSGIAPSAHSGTRSDHDTITSVGNGSVQDIAIDD
jgi:hypothetical protein